MNTIETLNIQFREKLTVAKKILKPENFGGLCPRISTLLTFRDSSDLCSTSHTLPIITYRTASSRHYLVARRWRPWPPLGCTLWLLTPKDIFYVTGLIYPWECGPLTRAGFLTARQHPQSHSLEDQRGVSLSPKRRHSAQGRHRSHLGRSRKSIHTEKIKH